MRIIDLAVKDIKQILRDRKSLLFLVLMPVVFTYFMGLAFGSGAKEEDTRLPLGWQDADNGALSIALRGLLDESGVVRLVVLEANEDGEAQVRQGQLAGLVRVPAGFSAAGSDLEALPSLDLTLDEASSSGQAVRQVVQTALVRVLAADFSAQASLGKASTLDSQATLAQALELWRQPPLGVQVQKLGELQDASAKSTTASGFNQTSPGIMVQFAIFGLVSSATVLVIERKARTLPRMLTTQTRRVEIIAGHLLAMFLVGLAQGLLLVVVGQFAFGVDYLRQPLAILLVVAALALWVACMGLLIGVLAKGEEQAILFAMLAMFVFSALGGAWFPLEGTGRTFSQIGHLTPGAWAMDGLQNILVRGLGLASVWLPVGVLLAYAAAFFALAVWRFRFDEAA